MRTPDVILFHCDVRSFNISIVDKEQLEAMIYKTTVGWWISGGQKDPTQFSRGTIAVRKHGPLAKV